MLGEWRPAHLACGVPERSPVDALHLFASTFFGLVKALVGTINQRLCGLHATRTNCVTPKLAVMRSPGMVEMDCPASLAQGHDRQRMLAKVTPLPVARLAFATLRAAPRRVGVATNVSASATTTGVWTARVKA